MHRSLGLIRFFLSSLLVAALSGVFPASAYAADNYYWQDVRAPVSIHELATNGSVYIGAGSFWGNGLWASTDLESWTRVDLPAAVGPAITSLEYKNGLFIAVSNTIATSRDGVTWSVSDVPVTLSGDYSAITYGKGLFVVVGSANAGSDAVLEGTILTSTDGQSWSVQDPGISLSISGSIFMNGVAWNGTRFVAAATTLSNYGSNWITDVILTSEDGKTWSKAPLPSDGSTAITFTTSFNDILAYGNGVFVAGGGAEMLDASLGYGSVYVSDDGLKWTAHVLPDGFAATGIEFVNGFFIAPGRTDYYGAASLQTTGYLVSSDGVNWEFASVNPDQRDLVAAGFAYSDGHYVTAGSAGVWTSPDLHTWSHAFSGPELGLLNCVGHGADAGYAAFSYGNGVIISGNGRDWWDDFVPVPTEIGYTSDSYQDGCIAYGPEGYVSNDVHSLDGTIWEASTVPPGEYIRFVAYDDSKYLAVAFNGYLSAYDVLTSEDGVTWTIIPDDLPDSFNPLALKVINHIVVLIGRADNGTWSLWTSPEGEVWTDVTPSAPDFIHPQIGYGDGVYIAMWNDANGNLKIAQSTDGSSWTVQTDAFPEGLPFTPVSMVYGGDVYLAAGFDSSRQSGAYLISDDGSHWTYAIDNRTDSFRSMLWDGAKFVAIGSYDILNSSGDMPGVLLDVSVEAPTSVEPSEQFTITVSVSNAGRVRADDVVLEDTLPGSAAYEKVATSQGKCTNGGSALSCELGAIAPGAKAIVTIDLTAGSAEGSIVNYASVHAYQSMRDDADAALSTTVVIKKPESSDNGSGGSDGGGGGAFGLLGFMSLLGFAMRRRMTSGE